MEDQVIEMLPLLIQAEMVEHHNIRAAEVTEVLQTVRDIQKDPVIVIAITDPIIEIILRGAIHEVIIVQLLPADRIHQVLEEALLDSEADHHQVLEAAQEEDKCLIII